MARRLLALALLPLLAACGGGGGGNSPAAPVATPLPTPQPTPTPNPFAAACGQPLPAIDDTYGFKVKVQSEPSPNRKWLTASPLIRNEAYCTATGQPGNTCATRFEDMAERAPCDHYVAGISDDGRPGPNWYEEVGGQRLKCGTSTSTGQSANCDVREESQYNLNIRAAGKYLACGGRGSNGSCGVCIIEESDWGYVHRSPAGLCKVG
jgi:hypothetical protein